MIGRFEEPQRRPFAEARDERFDERDFGERVARSLKEQHRYADRREVLGALGRGPSRRMQRKAQEHDVMRPPNDLPPANSGTPGKRRAASATAARTVAMATVGESGRFDPRSM
jgi:hypothetical protein